MDMDSKPAVRRLLRDRVAQLSSVERQEMSLKATTWVTTTTEFIQAKVVMLFLSLADEIDTAPLALRCWQSGKTVVVPKVSWDQRRMLPVEISSLTTGIARTGRGLQEPVAGKPVPVGMIDLVMVAGVGFGPAGNRIGRGMGFYDRFLSQGEFIGHSCGFGFETQVIDDIPMLDHDIPLSMLVTERGVRRFAPMVIHHS